MTKFLKKLNFFPGILLIIIFVIPARIAENIVRALLELLNNIFFYFDWLGISGGYLTMFYEKLIIEGAGAATYCAGMLLFPMFLNERFFKKFQINWLPGIIFVFIFFTMFALYYLYSFIFLGIGKMDWIDSISILVMFIGYTAGYLMIIYTSLKYSKTKNKYAKIIIDKFDENNY